MLTALGRVIRHRAALGLVLFSAFACAPVMDRATPELPGPPRSLDHWLADVATRVPEFGGMFLGPGERTLEVYLTTPTTDKVTAVQNAIVAVFGATSIPPGGIHVVQGRYGFLELQAWFARMANPVLSIPGVSLVDIGEAQNRLRIGLERSDVQAPVLALLGTLNIPSQAVLLDTTGPITFASHTLQQALNPTAGGVQIATSSNLCSLGFNANRGGVYGFVTASHCTNVQGGVEGTSFGQPNNSPQVAVEIVDPVYFTTTTDPLCPAGRQCRYSDSAFIQYNPALPDPTINDGLIARTTAITTTALNPITTISHTPPTSFFIKAGASIPPLAGTVLNKVGRTTGRSQGPVGYTCATLNVSMSNVTIICQYHVGPNGQVAGGDSGAAVFKLLAPSAAELHGVLWGRTNNQNFFFSFIGSVQHSATELGPLGFIYCGFHNPPTC